MYDSHMHCLREAPADPDADTEACRLLDRIVAALVDHPEDITISGNGDSGEGSGLKFTVRAHPSDVGKLIGRHGLTAKSLRTLMGGFGSRLQRRYTVVIDNGDVGGGKTSA